MSSTDTQTEITLKGSIDIVSEFFFTAINSILYQRGIYQPETFKRESKYGLTVLTTTDEGLLKYMAQVMSQVETWLQSGDVQRLVVVVTGVDSLETLERWQFNVALDGVDDVMGSGSENQVPNSNTNTNSNLNSTTKPNKGKSKKSIQEIHGEIQAIIRQITASVTFLPLLNEPCSFDLLVYTKKDTPAPTKWEDSDPCYIMNSQEVKLRSFTTTVHKVDSMVAYREAEDWEL
mmetsp:Transcript_35228/g.85262  ORF Transcript_35228/g.85262 Transcript_35228/m.85262 type:complete len:233 (+) Transcript_35228:112-810(+)